jgi:hypothetical protein
MVMRVSRASLAIGLMLLVASAGYAQAPKTHRETTPDCSAQDWDAVVAHFNTRVRAYVDLRSKLEKGLPALTVTADTTETMRTQLALAKRIRGARAGAKQGDIFTPAIGVEFRKALLREVNANTWAVIMDDNPGELLARVNGAYPEGKPLSTVPPNILAVLPALPDDIEYRFVERHLILLDTRARLILDRIPYALRPSASDTPCQR